MADLVAAASITLSAGTYLFDFASNMAVAYEYGRFAVSCNTSICRRSKAHELRGIFICMVVALVFAHTWNVVLFKLRFKQKDSPLRAAWFLPLMHLWRLADLLWRTLSFKGVQDLRSEEMSGLYNILGASFESAPFLFLQYCAYLVLYNPYNNDPGKKTIPPGMTNIRLFLVSTVASILSVAYNGGLAVQSVAKNAKTLKAKLAVALVAGLFTLCSTVSRCYTYSNSLNSSVDLHTFIWLKFLTLSLISYWLFYWLLQFPKAFSQRVCDPKRCFASFVFAYMSILLGPLYPMVSEAKDQGELGKHVFHARLFIVVLLNVSADMTMPVVEFGWQRLRASNLPFGWKILGASSFMVPAVLSVGCLAFIILYIITDMVVSRPSYINILLEEQYEYTEGLENRAKLGFDGSCEVPIPPLVAEVQSAAIDRPYILEDRHHREDLENATMDSKGYEVPIPPLMADQVQSLPSGADQGYEVPTPPLMVDQAQSLASRAKPSDQSAMERIIPQESSSHSADSVVSSKA